MFPLSSQLDQPTDPSSGKWEKWENWIYVFIAIDC